MVKSKETQMLVKPTLGKHEVHSKTKILSGFPHQGNLQFMSKEVLKEVLITFDVQ